MKKSHIFIIVGAIYLLFVTFIIKPWEFKSLSLIDDPFMLVETSKYYKDCISGNGCELFWGQVFESGSGRFRPIYWIINLFLYNISGQNPITLHVFRYYVIGLMAMLAVSWACVDLKGGLISSLLATSLLMINPSFTQNTARLGTPDLYLVILLIFISIYVMKKIGNKKQYKWLFILVLLSVLIKETAIVVVAPLFFIQIINYKKKIPVKFLVMAIIIIIIFLVGRKMGNVFPSTTLASFPEYVSNYSFNPLFLIQNIVANTKMILDLTSPVVKLGIIISVIMLFFKKQRKILLEKKIIYWMVFSLSFILIMIPWKYVLPRYHLIAVSGIYIVTGVLIEKAFRYMSELKTVSRYKGYIYPILGTILFSNIFFRNFAISYPQTVNYISWYKTFLQFEDNQVRTLLRYPNEEIYINATDDINNLEVIYGLPIILREVYSTNANIHLLSETPPPIRGLIFSRSALEASMDLLLINDYGKKLEGKEYEVKHLDAMLFKENFLNNPIMTMKYPLYSNDPIKYYWELREI